MESALLEGAGDVIAYGVIVTPERETKVLFTTPIDSDVKQVIVSGPKGPPILSLEDLSGKQVYVNPLTAYYETLQRLSDSLQKAGKPPILLKKADANLTNEDLLEMVNAGLIPATVTIGMDPDPWFGNVELVVAKDVGQQTVQYVSNIYKYYVAYKLTLDQAQTKK
ncbi:MAG: transporter substrate-binding domain-containing protein [Candidatus Acidiferrales bacterium]